MKCTVHLSEAICHFNGCTSVFLSLSFCLYFCSFKCWVSWRWCRKNNFYPYGVLISEFEKYNMPLHSTSQLYQVAAVLWTVIQNTCQSFLTLRLNTKSIKAASCCVSHYSWTNECNSVEYCILLKHFKSQSFLAKRTSNKLRNSMDWLASLPQC